MMIWLGWWSVERLGLRETSPTIVMIITTLTCCGLSSEERFRKSSQPIASPRSPSPMEITAQTCGLVWVWVWLGVEQRRNRKLIQKPKFRFLDQTFGFCRFRFRRKQKDSGEESRKIIFFAFTLESENKILPLIQKSEFNILLSLSKINAKKIIFLLSSPESFCFRRNRNLQKPKV